MKKLDWNRLVGFDQYASDRDSLHAATGFRASDKAGFKVGVKLGQKEGGKTKLGQ